MYRLPLVFIVALLAACQPMAVQRHEEGPVPVTLRVDDAAYWLEEWHRLMALPPDQIGQALLLREQEFARKPDARARLRLALLLVEGPSSVRDARRARALLAEMDEAHTSPSERALAAFLEQVVRERLVSADKNATLRQALADSQQRVKELERQLQELTNIEQSIQKRETPVDRKE